jgi:phosphoribosylanthranilate isomerase
MPSGPGVVADELAADIVRRTPPPIATFMLTSETTVAGILTHHNRVLASTIQLVDAVPPEAYNQLRQAIPTVKLVQVIHVIDERSLAEASAAVVSGSDALLLDSGNPNLTVKELGGTGRTHNWQISRAIVAQSPIPVFLAGGLNAATVRVAIEQVQPFGLDICSGVRTNGRLDLEKLRAFMDQVR